MTPEDIKALREELFGTWETAPCRGATVPRNVMDTLLTIAEREGQAAQRALEAVCAWLDTLPWRGSGALTPGEMAAIIRRGDHVPKKSKR